MLEDTDYDLLSECSGSSSAEAKEKTLVVLESKPLTLITSKKKISFFSKCKFYSFSIVHKSTVSDAVTLPSYLYTHELA